MRNRNFAVLTRLGSEASCITGIDSDPDSETDRTDPTDRTDRTDRTDPTDRTDRTDPATIAWRRRLKKRAFSDGLWLRDRLDMLCR
ncbi:MAG: hypothetical protein PHF14_05660 [Verrucomicrobiota bacterium]|nr:hypothetical protein [Verrucomicrobiota bacterium]MDD8045929.1 hypothetical protein [Verrucomicrobiota bacterium]